jgi:hypothetical protein
MAKTIERNSAVADLPAEKQAVVEAFTEVIRRHPGESATALAHLASLAFSVTLGGKAGRQDKVALAVARGLEARQELAEAEGGSLSSEEVARLLRISKTAVLKRLEVGRLLAWREERLRAARFPGWQFGEHGQVLGGLSEVLQCLNQDPGLDVWGRILFFLQTKTSLGGRRPLDLLREGRVKQVCQAARAYVD